MHKRIAILLVLSGSIFAQTPEHGEIKVWANTKSGIYHCPSAGDSRQHYEERGNYEQMTQEQAKKEGYRPARYAECGVKVKQFTPKVTEPQKGETK